MFLYDVICVHHRYQIPIFGRSFGTFLLMKNPNAQGYGTFLLMKNQKLKLRPLLYLGAKER
jgi:hypothetical protein